MESKVLCVFYDENCYPFKDSERSVRYPIIGNAFNGANNTTQIRFYVDRIGGTVNAQWVAITKLPNGQIGSQVLENSAFDNELGEYYVTLDLSSFYTSLKGDIYISLNGYQGGVNYEEDDGIYSIYGTPTIQATGCIKLAINYAPQMFPTTHFAIDDLQQILGLFSQYQKIENSIVVIGNIASADLSGYDDGQFFYDVQTKTYYEKDSDLTPMYKSVENGNGILGSGHTIVRYVMGVSDTIQSIDSLINNRVSVLSTGIMDYLCFVSFGTVITGRNIRIIELDTLRTYKNTYDTTGSNTLNNLVFSGTKDEILHESNYKDFAVPYSGATKNVDLGSYKITTSELNIENSGYSLYVDNSGHLHINVDQGALILETDGADIEINPNSGYLLYDGEEVATKPYVDDNIYVMPSSLVTLSDSEYNYVTQNNTRIKYGNDYYEKAIESDSSFAFVNVAPTYTSQNGGEYTRRALKTLALSKSTKTLGTGTQTLDFYSKTQADNKFYNKNYIDTYLYTKAQVDSNFYNKTQVDNLLSSTYNYKGTLTVAQINALNTSILKVGDVYNVSDSGTITLGGFSVVAGDNVAWSGSAWDKLAGTIDLSGYLQKSSSTNTLYGVNGSAQQVNVNYGSSVNNNYIVQRNGSGQVLVPQTPSDNAHATSKEYVDTTFTPQTRTIASLPLSANISAQSLTDNLVFMNNTSDIDYVMGD